MKTGVSHFIPSSNRFEVSQIPDIERRFFIVEAGSVSAHFAFGRPAPALPRIRRRACAQSPDQIGVVSWAISPAAQPTLQPQKDV